MPMVAEVMQESGIAFAELDLIAATVGPGSFTGVRIAIAAARGLALVTAAGLFGTDSLTVMARSALASGAVGAAPFAVAVDARRGMLYLGLYDEAARKLEGPLLIAPDEAADLLPPDLRVAAGSGAALLAEAGARQGAASPRRCRSFSRAPQRWPKSPLRAARPRRRSDRFICVRPMQGRRRKRSRGADAGRDRGHTRRPARRCVDGGHSPSCFAKAWDEAAMAQFLPSPDALCLIGSVGRQLGRRAGRPCSSRGRPPTRRRFSRSASRPLAANAGLGRALLAGGHGAPCAPAAPSDFSSKSRTATRPRSRSIARSARCRSGRRDGLLRARRRRRDLQPCPFTGPEDDGTALARRPASDPCPRLHWRKTG